MMRVKYQGLHNGQNWANLFYVHYAGSLTGVDLNTLAVEFNGAWGTAWPGVFPAGSTLNQTSCWDLSTAAGTVGISTIAQAGARPIASGALPNNSACCISWKVQYRWRGGHPRTYIPASAVTDTSAGHTWVQAYLDAVTAAAQNFMTQIAAITIGGQPAALWTVRYYGQGGSTKVPPVPLPQPIPLAVLSAVVHTRMDSQRRRLGKEIY